MFKRFMYVLGFLPILLATILVAGALTWVAVVAWVFTDEMPTWPHQAFFVLDAFSDWAGV